MKVRESDNRWKAQWKKKKERGAERLVDQVAQEE